MNENTDFQKTISDHVVLFKMDAEKEGVDLAKAYGVKGYPSFILLNGDSETMDRWLGFGGVEPFSELLAEVTTNPMTVRERSSAFGKEPSAENAAKLAGIRSAEGYFAEAMQYYDRAEALGEARFASEKFETAAEGFRSGLYSLNDVKTYCDVLMSKKGLEDGDMLQAAMTMFRIGTKAGDVAMTAPYMKSAMKQTAKSEDKDVVRMRSYMMPEYALHIEKDEKKAISAKKDAFPEGWENNAGQLNAFAWWCFENNINLQEAKTMAEKGVEVAENGVEKGNILDTLAEICNLTGDCEQAVALIKQAIAEAPDNEYFQKQLVRFEEIVQKQKRG